jgi:hypothetical protein
LLADMSEIGSDVEFDSESEIDDGAPDLADVSESEPDE